MRRLDGLFRVLTGRRSAWVCIVVAIGLVGALFALLPAPKSEDFPAAGLPEDMQSQEVQRIIAELPSADTTSAIVVYWRDQGELTADDRAAIEQNVPKLSELSLVPTAVNPQYAKDNTAALLYLPLENITEQDAISELSDEIRTASQAKLPEGLEVALSGPLGFQSDIANAFAGADTRLLLVTVLVVAILLILTYRSPILWLVPLIVVAVGDGLARQVIGALGIAFDTTIDASVTGIVSVLVFGAGTNYALLIVARYREELLRVEDHRQAMRQALHSTYPAVIASGSTVALSLLTLLLATLESNHTLGWAGSVGIVLAMCAALLVLPPAIVVCGRKLFWPFIPRYAPGDAPAPGLWERLGRMVARRPKRTIVAAAAGLAILSCGLIGIQVGLPQTKQFVGSPESVTGQEVIAQSFDAGLSSPTLVVVPEAATQEASALITQTPGVVSVRPSDTGNGVTVLAVTLDAAPATEDAYQVIRSLRDELGSADSPVDQALVGGADAQSLDQLTIAQSDQKLIVPVILVMVFIILMLLLRSLLAPILLMITVVATFAAALGTGYFIFTRILDYPGVDTAVPLFSFLFLVALGVDYNIFLTTRAREERAEHGTREGMIRALAATGGVITSAGVVLAAVFAVLGVLPIVALMQIGVIVCLGVLLDTLVVRTLVVPALAFWLGDTFWWAPWASKPAAPAVTPTPAEESA